MKLKRIISLLLVVIIMVSTFVTSVQASETLPDLLIGDADRDGIVTVMDATTIALHLAQLEQLDEMSLQVAKTDFSSDSLSIIDSTIIQLALAGFDDDVTREVGKTVFIYKDGEYKSALDDYQELLDKLMTQFNVSGVAYVTRNGRVMCQGAYGMQNTKENIPMSIDTLFPVGSVSKQFCATAIMMLKDQGLLSVNDTIDKYFPDYKYASDITIHQLLCMRSGIYDCLNDNPDAANLFIYDNEEDNQRAMLKWIYDMELNYTPGARYSYSNSNYFLLSLIVEQLTGMDYSDFIQENIFDKLSMTNTGMIDDLQYSENLAEAVFGEGEEMTPHPCGIAQGAGEIVSNAKDMDKWITAMRQGTFLSEESYKMMTTDYSNDEDYGYGLFIKKGNKYYHGGNILSYESAVYGDANNNINAFVVTNDVMTTREKKVVMTTIAQRMVNKVQ